MKDQYVIACIDRPTDADTVLAWASALAERLRHKGLIALNVSPDGDAPWLNELHVPHVGLRGQWRTAIDGLPTAFGGILAVTAVDPDAPRQSLAHPYTLLRQFRGCKIAYLCVPTQTPFRLQRAALTLNHRREAKEKLLWASYLARFCGTALTIAHPHYTDPALSQRLQNNIRFARKMYAPLQIEFQETTLARTVKEDHTALDLLRPDLLVAMTTDTRDRLPIGHLLPTPERHLLSHPSRTPILLLNTRDDLYILCD